MHTQLTHDLQRPGLTVGPAAFAHTTLFDRVVGARLSARGEIVALIGLLLAIFGVLLLRLNSVIISDMDEGTYLYSGKLIAEGLAPYRDFLLAHPPLTVYMAAGWIRLAGSDVMNARIANLIFVLSSTVPLYLTVRHLTRSRIAGLLGIVTYITGSVLLANMGRVIKLEPVVSAFLIAAFAIYALRPNAVRWRVIFGVLVAAALLTKFVAIVPVGLIVLGDVIWSRSRRSSLRLWLVAAGGAAVILVPTVMYLLTQPYFVQDVLWSQLQRNGLPLELRLRYLGQDFLRYPVIPVSLLACAWFLRRGSNSLMRVTSLVGLVGMLILVLFFKTFFTYYLVLVLPWLAIVFVVVCVNAAKRLSTERRRMTLAALVVVLGLFIPAAYAEAYYRTGAGHVSSPAQIIPRLEQGHGYIYSMYPLFSLWTGRPEYPWYYSADALIPRTAGTWTSGDFIQAFAGSQAVVLWEGELADYPQAAAYLETEFQPDYRDNYFSLWVRRAPLGQD